MKTFGGPRDGPSGFSARKIAPALALAAAASCFALDWPIASVRVAATFGTPAKARLITGTLLAAETGAVEAAGAGELAYAVEEGRHPAGLPTPLGSFVVVQHEGGLAAVYAHLAPDSTARRPREARPGVILGRVGDSGWTEGPGLLFQVFDREEGAWVNPLLVLPPVPDAKPPQIRSVALVRGGKSYVLGEVRSIGQGSYAIAVDAADGADSPWSAGPPAPYAIRLSIDGSEIAREVFDAAKGKDGRLSFFRSAPRSLAELRTAEGRYLVAERLFARGKTVVEVAVEDIAGNRRSASWTISVE